MKIRGPFKDKAKASSGQTKVWYLSYFAPKQGVDGTTVLTPEGAPMLQRHRPYYETRAQAEADRPRIEQQYDATGGGSFLFDRNAASDYESARAIVGAGVSLIEVARFWRLHHPSEVKPKVKELVAQFLSTIEDNLGKERHWSDLKWRLGAFVDAGFGERYPDTIKRDEILNYLRSLKKQDGKAAAPRTTRNQKTTICNFFNWLVQGSMINVNPAAGIKKRMLPKDPPKEIRYLSVEYVRSYLRCAERYAPDLVAHEVIQLVSGVRADDEMANFRAEFVLPNTREIVIPAAIAKTGKREVIDIIEESFWAWWSHYGPKEGLLRPRNYEPKWKRLRALASVADRERADELARLPIKTLLALPEMEREIERWPWNARRRSFCTYHIAMHQSADRTALILRHRGAASTLHNSYRGLGASKADGVAYFSIRPEPVDNPISPEVELRGIVKIQADVRSARLGLKSA